MLSPRALALVLPAVVGVCTLPCVGACQRKMVYDPDPHVATDPSQLGLAFERLSLHAEDRKTIAAWFVPAGSRGTPRRGTVIYSHGNGGNIGTRLPMIEALVGLGLDVLIYDYHGYGDSEGRPGEKQTYRAARAAWDWATESRRIPAGEIVLWGRSLGGAVTVWLATRPDVQPAAVVLESTYTSLIDVGEHLHPRLPVRAFSIFEYPSLERIGRLRAPLLYAHSPDDEIVPFALGQRLYDAAPEPKRFVRMQGAHVPTHLTLPAYREPLAAFVDEIFGAP